jgi:hypothetical protein
MYIFSRRLINERVGEPKDMGQNLKKGKEKWKTIK